MKVWRLYLSILDTWAGRFVSWAAALVAAIKGGARDPKGHSLSLGTQGLHTVGAQAALRRITGLLLWPQIGMLKTISKLMPFHGDKGAIEAW